MGVNKSSIIKFILKKQILVLSTHSDNGYPNGALLYYLSEYEEETDVLHLYIMTAKGSGKYNDIKKNNKVAFVIGTELEPITVQGRAEAVEIQNNAEIASKLDELIKIAKKHADFWPPILSISDKSPSVFQLKVSSIKGYDARGYSGVDGFEDNHQFFFELSS